MKCIIALSFIYLVFISCDGKEHIVHPYHCSSSNTCLTLEDYINKSNVYFKSHNKFTFLPGDHKLSTTLIINNITNLTFEGVKSSMLAIGSIKILNSSEILIMRISIRHTNTNQNIHSVLQVEVSSSIYLQELQFFKINYSNYLSRAADIFKSKVIIINCSFYGGSSDEGGALRITSGDVTCLDKITFMYNCAKKKGGAISIQKSVLTLNGNISFHNNKVFENSVNRSIGGAIYAFVSTVVFVNLIEQGNYSSINIQSLVRTYFNCSVQFLNNSGTHGGAIYSYNSTLLFEGKAYLAGNVGSRYGGAIYAFGESKITFNGYALFSNNTAQNTGGGLLVYKSRIEIFLNLTLKYNVANNSGGGIDLKSSELIISGEGNFFHNEANKGGSLNLVDSKLVLKPPATLLFYHNKAKFGGAIFYKDKKTYYSKCLYRILNINECFFNFPSIDSIKSMQFFFNNNEGISGSDVFGGNLEYCKIKFQENLSQQRHGWETFKEISIFNHTDYDNSSLSSNPLAICFCDRSSSGSTCSQCCKVRKVTLHIPHGRTFNLSVVAVGQTDSPVPSEILHSFVSRNGAELHRLTSYYDDASTSCHNISFKLLSSQPRETFNLYPAMCKSEFTSSLVNIVFSSCPPGFELLNRICECERKLEGIINSCIIETGLVKHPGKIWIQPLINENLTYKGFMWTKHCPTIFCISDSSNSIWLNFSRTNADSQCLRNRTGVMCGSCKENYSLTLNSLDCSLCSNSFIALTLAFFFAGIIIIAVLLGLHVTVSSGTINGLILYANIVNISKDVFFPPTQRNDNFLPVFIAWLNLDFGISTCFFRGLNFYAYTWLQFAFPFYLWILIGIIILISKYSTKVSRLFGSNPVAVLATVILMSFTKLLHASYSALAFTILKYSNNMEKKVWKLDPSISYFRGKHIPLAVFAISVIAILIIPYIVLLLLGYHLQALSHKSGFSWINKFKPLLDSYYAPYQKHTRFWTGYLLVVRICIYIIYVITEEKDLYAVLIAVSTIFAGTSLIPWVGIQVHEKKSIEILEASFIFNILILAIGTYHIRSRDTDSITLPLFSVGVAFTEFIGITIFHVAMRLQHWQVKAPNKVWKYIHTSFIKKFKGISESQETCDKVQNADMANYTMTSISIREPLLDVDVCKL